MPTACNCSVLGFPVNTKRPLTAIAGTPLTPYYSA